MKTNLKLSQFLLLLVLLVKPPTAHCQSFPTITLDGAQPQKTFILDTPHSNGRAVRVGTISSASWQALYQLGYLPTGYGSSRPANALVVLDNSTGAILTDSRMIAEARMLTRERPQSRAESG